MHPKIAGAALLLYAAIAAPGNAQSRSAAHPALSSADVDDIARLELLEDRRLLDTNDLGRILAAPHPELRRRAALAIARIADKRGIAMLRANPLDHDTAVAATTVFAVGQLRDTGTVAWLDSLLTDPKSAPTVATEAAVALGKLKTAHARAALAVYLARTTAIPRNTATIGEALLSIGRALPRGDLAPIIKWTHSTHEEIRWRATWALFRPRDPAAVATLLVMSKDSSALVRSWAVRGLTKPQADSSNNTVAAETLLLAAAKDPDRRVRTEAIRALATYGDGPAFSAMYAGLRANDSWIAVSAAEGLGRMRGDSSVARLVGATAGNRPCAVRLTAMQSLQAFAPAEALAAAKKIAGDTPGYCRTTALQAIARDTTRSMADRRADVSSSDPIVRAAALRAMGAWGDTSDLPFLLDVFDKTRTDSSTAIASAAAAAVAGVQRRHGAGASIFFARFTTPPSSTSLRRDVERAFGAAARQAWQAWPAWPAAAPAQRPASAYRAIVERWIVPDYEGKPHPIAVWETPRGPIELELYPGDAPLAVDDFVRTIESRAIVGTEFTRVVPDFVDQQRTIRDENILRDEVNRHRLTRANLAWATAGLDTGSPGYTLNHTPQPHNEGDFTSLGRVIRGMDAVDRIQLGDRVTAARMLTGVPPR
ncbi:MAG: HEAT repeat domain-containing protein [Gemmatimonadaceae bacterium]